MYVDATTLGEGDVVEADVCVAGAGPAGIATALELASGGVDVALVERGARTLEGEVEGNYPPLESARAGGIGGTAALWVAELAPGTYGARYAPLAPLDFEEREDVPWSGWPFGRSELDRWYARAHELCDAGPYVYDAEATGVGPNGRLATTMFRFGYGSVFTHSHREALVSSPRVRVLEPATAVAVETDRHEVTGLQIATAPGQVRMIRARAYVLALGGIENARFLLLGGLGNEHDLVGRFLMDHPTARCRLDALPGATKQLAPYDVRGVEGRPVLASVALKEATIAAERLLHGGFFFVPAREREARALESVGTLARSVRRRRLPAEPADALRDVLLGVDAIALEAHRRVVRRAPRLAPTTRIFRRARLLDTLGVGPISGWSELGSEAGTFDVHHVVEQAPEPDRRVTLGAGRDDLGRRLPHVRFFVSQRELESLDRTEELVAAELARAGLGRLRTARELAPEGDLAAALHPSAHHHLGTTRMDVDPRRGVVDENSRVHGLRNVYVTGGSVFPTAGYVNPTLTAVALAARLAAHLRQDVLR
jgi:choline dehydrogenase-like flavoprotein